MKDYLECAYYVAFIMLTAGLFRYSRKSYFSQIEKNSELHVKLHVPEELLAKPEYPFFLEIYNHGNEVAHNVQVFVVRGEAPLVTVPFIKPTESCYLCLGACRKMLGDNMVMLLDGTRIHKGSTIDVSLQQGNVDRKTVLETEILFLKPDTTDSAINRIASSTKDISKTLSVALRGGMVRDSNSAISRLADINDSIKSLGKNK